jgi:hypothetical protein
MAEQSIPIPLKTRVKPPHGFPIEISTRAERTFDGETVYGSKNIITSFSLHTVVMCAQSLLGVVYVPYSDAGFIPVGTAVGDANYYAPAVVSRLNGFWTKIAVNVSNSPFSYDLLNPPTRGDFQTKGPFVVSYKKKKVPLEKVIAEINYGQHAAIKAMAEAHAAQPVSAGSSSHDENEYANSVVDDDEDDDDDAEEENA